MSIQNIKNDFELFLKDNRFGDNAEGISNDLANILEPYSCESLRDYQKMGVEVFASSEILENEDNDKSLSNAVFYLSGGEGNWHINTRNCMGVLRIPDKNSERSVLLEIGSRFDNEKNQFFLAYMLSKAFGGCFTETVPSDPKSLWDFLLALSFRHHLQKACEVGMFKQFRSFEHNDLRFRGKFDINRHLRKNIPFLGKIAYKTKDITFDNPLNHLIRHAIARIKKKWPSLLSGDSVLAELRHDFEQHTPSWQEHEASKCARARENRNPIKHPFFGKYYEPLRRLSLGILRNEGASPYNAHSNQVEGILFDGAWLWENYLWTILKELGFAHPDNINKEERLKVFNSNYNATLFPDFYRQKKNDSESTVVLDAKYQNIKSLTDNDGESYIVKQILSYMFLLDARRGGIIVPQQNNSHPVEPINIKGRNATWSTLQLAIPQKQVISAGEFLTAIKKSEGDLIDKIKSLFS